MRRLLILLMMWLPLLVATAQTGATLCEATVVDAATGQRLPFATVSVGSQRVTIANAMGTFALNCRPTDSVLITHVGHKPVTVEARQMPAVVKLQPREMLLDEVVVLPIGSLIDRLRRATLRMQREHRREQSRYFYRQTAFCGAQCYEFAEAFISGGCAVWLSNLKLVNGRYAGLRSDSTHQYTYFGNFFTFSQIAMAASYNVPEKKDDVVPLIKNYQKYYDISYKSTTDDDGHRLIAITFEPLPAMLKRYAMIGGTLYVDEETLHILRFEGEGLNILMKTEVPMTTEEGKRWIKQSLSKISFNFVVDMTEERGFTEVQSVYIDESHKSNGETISTRSLLFNIGTDASANTNTKRGRTKSLEFGSKLHHSIEMRGYEAGFWQQDEIVKRTPVEQAVQELFEQHNLFGVMQ